MKKLIALLVATGLIFCSSNLSSQEIKFPHETDKNKFIPAGACVADVNIDTIYYGKMTAIWYNKECKSSEDYSKKLWERNRDIPRDELFLDLDVPQDGIPDLSLEGLDKWIEEYDQSVRLSKTTL